MDSAAREQRIAGWIEVVSIRPSTPVGPPVPALVVVPPLGDTPPVPTFPEVPAVAPLPAEPPALCANAAVDIAGDSPRMIAVNSWAFLLCHH